MSVLVLLLSTLVPVFTRPAIHDSISEWVLLYCLHSAPRHSRTAVPTAIQCRIWASWASCQMVEYEWRCAGILRPLACRLSDTSRGL